MVESQYACSASLVNASSALSAVEKQEVKGESNVNHAIAELSAELHRERQKNEELLNKISFLEAQIHQRTDQGQEGRKKFKRQKTEVVAETENAIISETVSEQRNETECLGLVNWMSMEEKVKDGESTADFYDTDDSVDNEDDGNDDAITRIRVALEPNQEAKEEVKCINRTDVSNSTDFRARSTDISRCRKPPKVAFCPREVQGIIASECLQKVNAQAHTMRKIVVFASLGIKHGCDDMHDLDFSHFSILRKGEPFESSTNPGEHVVYENPGQRRKIFYPNRQNPTLCPVRILEEEKAMRPLDSGCPSCLFLCIKYGGRTRNLPQNEYVRQRMGRNKLKSFGPLVCRAAKLANVRHGSFFFKALGISLLFMAGFPNELVQKETNYRNLELLQKYYRTDEEAEGEELFLQHPEMDPHPAASPSSQRFTGQKPMAKKKKKKKQANSHTKQRPHSTQATSLTIPSRAMPGSGANMSPSITCHGQMAGPYFQMLPHHPTNAFVPPTLMYFWRHPHYTSPYHHGHMPFPFSRSQVSTHVPQPRNPGSHEAHGSGLKEAESDRSSSSTKPA